MKIILTILAATMFMGCNALDTSDSPQDDSSFRAVAEGSLGPPSDTATINGKAYDWWVVWYDSLVAKAPREINVCYFNAYLGHSAGRTDYSASDSAGGIVYHASLMAPADSAFTHYRLDIECPYID